MNDKNKIKIIFNLIEDLVWKLENKEAGAGGICAVDDVCPHFFDKSKRIKVDTQEYNNRCNEYEYDCSRCYLFAIKDLLIEFYQK